MLEKITDTFSNIIRTISGKSTITEKNIEETVEQIKMALLEADVNLRVVRRFVNSTIEEAKGETEFAILETKLLAQETVTLNDEDKATFNRLLTLLDDCDDVQQVYHNVENI